MGTTRPLFYRTTAVLYHIMAILTLYYTCKLIFRLLYGYGYRHTYNCIDTVSIQLYTVYSMMLIPRLLWQMVHTSVDQSRGAWTRILG